MMKPFVSVVVATRNRQALLAQALETLAGQHWPRERFEIVVADNGSTDDTRAVVQRFAKQPGAPATHYLFVREPGKSHAVNAAFAHARGELLALTDDDVLAEPDWLERLVSACDDANVDFVAGRVLPRWESGPPAWMSPALHGVLAIPDNGDRRVAIGPGSSENLIPIGANMAVRASVVRRLGGLRVDLGKLDGTLRTGEDHEFFLRMVHWGCRGIYEPEAVVHHWVPTGRLEPEYFRRWLYQNGRDVAVLDAEYPAALPRLFGAPRYHWRQAAANLAHLTGAALVTDERKRFAALARLVWFSGYLRESWFGAAVTAQRGMSLAEEQ